MDVGIKNATSHYKVKVGLSIIEDVHLAALDPRVTSKHGSIRFM